MSVPQSRLSPRALIYWEARQAHAQQRIQDGATLTPAEREALVALLPAGVPTAGLPEAVAEVDYNSAFYWHSILLVPRSNPAPALRGLASDAAKLAQKLAAADASSEWSLIAIPPELLRALEDNVPGALRVLEQGIPEFSPPLRRSRAVGFEHHGGGRVEIMQHAIEQLEVCALAAAEQTPSPRRAKGDEPELRRLMEKLRLVWTERLGLPYQPYARKRKGTGAFIIGAIAIIDPHVRAATITRKFPYSPLQKPRILENYVVAQYISVCIIRGHLADGPMSTKPKRNTQSIPKREMYPVKEAFISAAKIVRVAGGAAE